MVRLLLGAAALMVLTGCGGPDPDIPAIEQEIKAGIHDQVGTSVTVDCPDSIEWRTGGEFHCFADEKDGTRHRVTVSMENDDGDATWVVDN